jgi:all-trans-retinol dehydrogenase (NAD+)
LKVNGHLPKKNVEKDHVFITGAGSGLGRMIGLEFLKLGSKVTFADINDVGLEQSLTAVPES